MLLLTSDRLGKSTLCTPAFIESISDGGGFNGHELAPFRYRLSLSVESDIDVGARVVGLRNLARPITIAWAIASVVIVSLYRMLWCWAFTHIIDEILERIDPTGTYGNPSSPVPVIVSCIRAIASRFHLGPNAVLRRMREVVGSVSFTHLLIVETAARFRYPPSEAISVYGRASPAIADREPHGVFSLVRCPRKYNPSAKAPACDILQFSHWLTLSKLMFRWPGASNTRFTDHSSMWAAS